MRRIVSSLRVSSLFINNDVWLVIKIDLGVLIRESVSGLVLFWVLVLNIHKIGLSFISRRVEWIHSINPPSEEIFLNFFHALLVEFFDLKDLALLLLLDNLLLLDLGRLMIMLEVLLEDLAKPYCFGLLDLFWPLRDASSEDVLSLIHAALGSLLFVILIS